MTSRRNRNAASGMDYGLIGSDHDGQDPTRWTDDSGVQQVSGGVTIDDPETEREDSATGAEVAEMIPSASEEVRKGLTFRGTPERGWYEPLDSTYRVRTKGEAHRFFQKGRVFAMLWAETASETWARKGTENTAITVGRFRQNVYSQIRRFVVVAVNRRSHYVYACAISTYGGQGTLKRGCKASEHTIVYIQGSQPTRLAGEWERGMTKDPIMIEPTDANETMALTSRLRCGKIYSIEWNVKVRDVGMVCRRDRTKLIRYHKEEEQEGFDPDTDGDDEVASQLSSRAHEWRPSHQQPQATGYHLPQQDLYYQRQQSVYHPPQQAGYQQTGYAPQTPHQYPHMPPYQHNPQYFQGAYAQQQSQSYLYPPQHPPN